MRLRKCAGEKVPNISIKLLRLVGNRSPGCVDCHCIFHACIHVILVRLCPHGGLSRLRNVFVW